MPIIPPAAINPSVSASPLWDPPSITFLSAWFDALISSSCESQMKDKHSQLHREMREKHTLWSRIGPPGVISPLYAELTVLWSPAKNLHLTPARSTCCYSCQGQRWKAQSCVILETNTFQKSSNANIYIQNSALYTIPDINCGRLLEHKSASDKNTKHDLFLSNASFHPRLFFARSGRTKYWFLAF